MKLDIPKEPTFTEQLQNQKIYDEKTKTSKKLLQKDDYVFVDLKSSGAFDKGYDVLVSKTEYHKNSLIFTIFIFIIFPKDFVS